MPGAVAMLGVTLGQKVMAGDVVATLEAMKMETALHAPRDGKIVEILVSAGQQVDVKDLLIVIG
jgi:pyruvate carboxylase